MRHNFLLLTLALAPALSAQTPALSFEVASIKPAATPVRQPIFCLIPCMVGERYTVQGNRLEIRYLTITRLIATAWRVKEYQLTGPDFIRSERFDIDAKLPAGGAAGRVPEMLQSLLANRFHLTFHRESKDENVYALVIGKNGFKLKEAAKDATVAMPDNPSAESLYTSGGGQARAASGGGMVVEGGPLGPLTAEHTDTAERIDLKRVTMAGLVELIAPHYERPVVDLTGLDSAYAMQIEIEHASSRGSEGGKKAAPSNDEIGSADPFLDSLKRAYDRAGLRIESRKAPVEHLIIDRLDRAPSAN